MQLDVLEDAATDATDGGKDENTEKNNDKLS
jgi:hypothetical protein